MKSDFRSDMQEQTAILPKIFSVYPEVRSGMSTKRGSRNRTKYGMNLSTHVGDDPAIVEMNRTAFFSQLGISRNELAIPLQSHSEIVRKVVTPGEYEKCDALITNACGVALGITVADCVPILLFDPIQNAIGAVHAGWRGTARGIVKRTIHNMQEEFKTDPEHVLAFIGPSAGVCCYEVSEEVAVKFEKKIVPYNKKKIFVDLKKENAAQLHQVGVAEDNMEISKHCTICESQLFHSYRRDGTNAGRMMAVIRLQP
ncbi:MAG: peptidoglycan editing factor PgeF [Ignavibacteriales bacterium]|nr:peptidoglycan editing factor PgeF [Ignavibacteriales bacterium]